MVDMNVYIHVQRIVLNREHHNTVLLKLSASSQGYFTFVFK